MPLIIECLVRHVLVLFPQCSNVDAFRKQIRLQSYNFFLTCARKNVKKCRKLTSHAALLPAVHYFYGCLGAHSTHYDKTKRQRGEALPLKKVLDYGESGISLYLLSSCVEGAYRRLNEELAVTEELAAVGIVGLNVVDLYVVEAGVAQAGIGIAALPLFAVVAHP